MSSIGKHINTVFPQLSTAKLVAQFESKHFGAKSVTQALDLAGDSKADLMRTRTVNAQTGLFRDEFTVRNSLLVEHDMVIFRTDEQGIVRHEFHFDEAKPGKPSRQVNLGDTDGDGKIDSKSIHNQDGSSQHLSDSDFDGTIDLEIRFSKEGRSQKSIPAPFFVDER